MAPRRRPKSRKQTATALTRPTKDVAESTEKSTGANPLPVGALRPQPHGGALRNGGTNKGGTGRPPDEFKALCRELASNAATMAKVRSILGDENHDLFLGALKWASEHGYGKPTQMIDTPQGGTIAEILARSWEPDDAGTE
jgi:hypothetical protein